MSTTQRDESVAQSRRSRTIRVLELEHDLIRRYARLLRTVFDGRREKEIAPSIRQLTLEFGERFLEGRHNVREERIFHTCFHDDDPAMDARMCRHEDECDDMRNRLEGMRRALESDDPGAITSFSWNAQSLASKILLHLNREEVEIMPLLEGRLDPATDARLRLLLGLDLAENMAEYAQAENVLLILSSI